MAVYYTEENLRNAVKDSICWSDVCRELNITICSHNFKKARERCSTGNIDYSHFNLSKAYRKNKKNWIEKEVYCNNSTFPRAQLRRKVLADKWLPYKCNDCGIEALWNNKPLTLEIEHKNGNNTDHNKENLTWLCPNCHSQTPTFRNNRNRRA
jgi:hypothetical protein